MKYDPASNSLRFASPDELEQFHLQLTDLVRAAMVNATRHIPDGEQAKVVSREQMKELRTVMSALNTIRAALPKKQF